MIPKKIHYCWFGSGDIPAKDKKCIESWIKFCPDYEIIQWNETNYDITKNEYMRQAYETKKWGFVPDFARLDIVYEYGGIYLDTDVELLRCLDYLLDNAGFAGFERSDHIALGLGFGAERKNPIIKKMLDQYSELKFVKSDRSLNLTPSPTYSTEILQREGFVMNGTLQSIENFTIYPNEYFCPRDYYTGKTRITQNSYSIHWFNSSWQTPHRRRMMKVRHIIGNRNYNKLVKLKNRLGGGAKRSNT